MTDVAQQSIDWAPAKVNFRQAVLGLLSDLRWHTNRELAYIGGNRYGGRIQELRDDGWAIADRWLPNRTLGKEYRLTSLATGPRRVRRVKVYLTIEDARAITRGEITPSARTAVREAAESFRARKGRK